MAEAGYPVSSQHPGLPSSSREDAARRHRLANRQANESSPIQPSATSSNGKALVLPLGSPSVSASIVAEETQRWGEVIRKARITLPN